MQLSAWMSRLIISWAFCSSRSGSDRSGVQIVLQSGNDAAITRRFQPFVQARRKHSITCRNDVRQGVERGIVSALKAKGSDKRLTRRRLEVSDRDKIACRLDSG